MNIFAFVKRTIFLFLIAFFFHHEIIAQKPGYRIVIKIPGMADTTCYLGNYYGDKTYLQDTARTDANGTVVFSGDEALPGGIYLFVFPDKRYFEIMVEGPQHFSMETSWQNPITDMKISGSPSNELFYRYLAFAVDLQLKTSELQKQYASAITKADSTTITNQIRELENKVNQYRIDFLKTHKETFLAKVFRAMPEPVAPEEIPVLPNGRPDSTFRFQYFKKHYLDSLDFADHRILRTPIFHAKIQKYIKDLTVQLPDSIIQEADYLISRSRADKEVFKYMVWWITNTYQTSKIMGHDAVFVHLVENIYQKGEAYWIDSAQLVKILDRAYKIAPNLIGNTAPELALKDTSGNWQILSKVPAEYTVLVFYDPDCGHCQKEIPALKTTYDKWKSKGVEVFAVDIEVDPVKWKKFIRTHNLDWINVNDERHESNFRITYDVYSTPVIYILDKKKVIRAKRISVEQVDELLTRWTELNEAE